MSQLLWKPIPPAKNGDLPDLLGFIIYFLDTDDPRPAKEQINERYAHGGGWKFYPGKWTMTFDADDVPHFRYPGDPPVRARGRSELHSERLFIMDHGYFAIVQPDGTFEIARLD